MFALPPSVRIYLSLEATDMRKGIDGLSALVQNQLLMDSFSGHLFCFFNKGRNKIKILYWDTTGFCLYLKRLEQGRFHLNESPNRESISSSHLQLILQGLDLSKAKQYKRYTLPTPQK
jgi:transposase